MGGGFGGSFRPLYFSIASNTFAKFEAHPITRIFWALLSVLLSEIQNVGMSVLQSSGSFLPVLWTAQAGAVGMFESTM